MSHDPYRSHDVRYWERMKVALVFFGVLALLFVGAAPFHSN